MNKTIGLFAHVDAGKTTLAEQLLYRTSSIQHRGRVDHRDAFMDSHEIERERGITVFADQAVMKWKDSTYYLIDTPGHVDFSPEMERAMQVMDYAVVIVSAVEGVEGHTATVWNLLQAYQVPTLMFINKVDRVGADVDKVLAEIRTELSQDVCHVSETDLLEEGRMSETLIEAIAERDEQLLEHYMEQGYDVDMWLQKMVEMLQQRRWFPCFSGSALQNMGIDHLLRHLDVLTSADYSNKLNEPFAGRVYKIRHDEQGTRLTYVKALSGDLRVRDEVAYVCGSEQLVEKATHLRIVNGTKHQTTERVEAGELFVVTGLSAASVGQGIGALRDPALFELVPTLKSRVMFDEKIHPKDMLRCLRQLDAEDPSLHVEWVESSQQIHIQVMGMIQLEVLKTIILDRFSYEVAFDTPEIMYRETIAASVVGSGHFEPLKHYAEVHLRLEPTARNTGLSFENACHPDVLPTNYQNLVAQHVGERDHRGLLTGSPLTDVKVTLLKGRAHNKHTHGGDFREATFRALRQGLEKTESVLLEPYYDFKIKVAADHIGRLMSDLVQASGQFDPPETLGMGEMMMLCGRVPVSTFMNYSVVLAAYTQGKGMMSLVYGGYDRCHNEAEVIERIRYVKDADPEYSSSSIFCAKGHGYAVPWDEADSHMHV